LTDLGLNDEELELEAFPELTESLQTMFYAQGDRIVCLSILFHHLLSTVVYSATFIHFCCLVLIFIYFHRQCISQANQYGGSGAMHKEALSSGSADGKRATSAGFASNAMTSIKRHVCLLMSLKCI
jgi:hypothetical protein